ncbi:uncharacterized protein [Penaeus vannamei]|uniref:uncharacterized protein n=1 Tax=Penaeus vannamei TaxID=6689 RepID=UPI00387F57A6
MAAKGLLLVFALASVASLAYAKEGKVTLESDSLILPVDFEVHEVLLNIGFGLMAIVAIAFFVFGIGGGNALGKLYYPQFAPQYHPAMKYPPAMQYPYDRTFAVHHSIDEATKKYQ